MLLQGAVVFPGGVADPSDSDPAWATFLGSALTPLQQLKLGALRELFEETGEQAALGGTH